MRRLGTTVQTFAHHDRKLGPVSEPTQTCVGHGWSFAGFTLDGGRVEIAPIIDERTRCGCPHCHHRATQEDLRCDFCRNLNHRITPGRPETGE